MANSFAQFAACLISLGVARPILPADVAPPVPYFVGGAAVALAVIGVFILVVVLISIRVIRKIKQDNTPGQED